MAADILNLAVVNFRSAYGNKQANLSRMEGFARAAAKRGAEMVVFPELCLMGYDYFINTEVARQDKLLASETLDGPSVTSLARLAQELGVYIVFGMSEKLAEEDDVLYNSAVALGPQGVIGSYQKIHPFSAESTWCAKGDKPFAFETPWGLVGVGICYDSYNFPELLRYYVYQGARLYLNPTALVEEVTKQGSREAFLRSYATYLECGVRANSVFIASANLTGYDGSNYFGGGSMILGPKTSPFAEVDAVCYAGSSEDTQQGVQLATIDLSLATRHLCVDQAYSHVPDYRPELYKTFY